MKDRMLDKNHRILANLHEYAEHLRTHGAPDIASKLNEIMEGTPKKWSDDFIQELVQGATEAYDEELASHGSRPRIVGVIVATLDYLSGHECTWESIDLEDLASDIEDWAGEKCDRPGCDLPKGHNQGKADVPSNHPPRNVES